MEKRNPADIAKEAMDKINKDKDAKSKAEPKGAAPAPSAEKEKTEVGKSLLEQAELQAKKDEELLSREEKDLSEEDKKRKQEILDKTKSKEPGEEKVNKRKAEIQTEIDKLISEKKALEDVKVQSEKMKDEIAFMQKELDDLKKEKTKIDAEKSIPEEQKVLKTKEEERLKKYLDEDGALSREQRREMPKEELEDWLLEDMVAAQEWMTERSLRRARERSADISNQKKDKFVKDFTRKQEESNARVIAKHPKLETAAREKELKSQGKSNEEIGKILMEENEEYRVSVEVIKENPEQYLMKENGPELVMAEMEKRLKPKPSSENKEEESSEIEKLKKQIEDKDAEIARLNGVDESIGSSRPGEKEKKEEKKTEFQLKQEALAKKAGISPERLKANIERRAKMGVSQ